MVASCACDCNTMATGDDTRLPPNSRDVHAERLTQLRELYPEAFSEGKTDLKKLGQLLGDSATDAPERYGLSWAGKSEAIRAIQITSPGTLLPARGESVNFDTTENLIIEGDNLEVLKLLQGSYNGRVKMIYIDPPYNTGGEFIYPDNYKEGLADYLKFSGQASGEGIRLATNAETDGRYHSKWLTMMYPRLFLARNLLREDGVIFVSIDDHEVHNLRAVMNEIFGEENFVESIVWKKRYGGGAKEKYLVSVHEYIMCYGREKAALDPLFIPQDEASIERYYKLEDENFEKYGPYRTHPLEATKSMGERKNLVFAIPAPDGTEIWPRRQWLWSKERAFEAAKNKEIAFLRDKDGNWSVHTKQYLKDATGAVRQSKAFSIIDNVYSQHGTNEILEIFGDAHTFSFPKPTGLLRPLLSLATEATEEDIILDFFGGSGTTAQAVLDLNARDDGNRKFILVQLPEPTERKDFSTIAEITKERVRRVLKKLESELVTKNAEHAKKSESELPLADATSSPQLKQDLGFKVFKLSSSNFKVWEIASAPRDGAGLAEQLKLMAHNVEEGRPDDALLYELVLKSNLPLTSKIQSGKIGAQTFYDVADGTVAICLERPIEQETLRGLVARKPKGVICLDIAFAGNDQLKANTALEMKSHGIEFHTA